MKMITTSNIEQARKQLKLELKLEKHPIIVIAQDDEFNRKILEYGKFDILLLHPSTQNKKPSINNILTEIATKNKIAIGIDLDEILKLEKKEKADELARLKQTIKVCRKAKTKLSLINLIDRRNALSLLISLGASSNQAKEAI